jgi:hypothetical protein
MKQDDFFKANGRVGSQFWKSLHKIKHLFKWGPFTRLEMAKLLNFEMMCGSLKCHSGSDTETYMIYVGTRRYLWKLVLKMIGTLGLEEC